MNHELQIKDTVHLTPLGQALWSLLDLSNTILPLKVDNLCITVKLHHRSQCLLFKYVMSNFQNRIIKI